MEVLKQPSNQKGNPHVDSNEKIIRHKVGLLNLAVQYRTTGVRYPLGLQALPSGFRPETASLALCANGIF